MTKIKNIIFIIVCVVLFCSVASYKAADIAGILPKVFDNGTKSYLEGRDLKKFPEPTLKNFTSGDFQGQFEQYCSDCFPGRDNVLLASAIPQRTLIEVANIPFRFEVYPTFFGSKRLYSPEHKALFFVPTKQTKETEASLTGLSDSMKTVFSEHDVNAVICSPDRSIYSSSNPAMQYVSDPITNNYYSEHIWNNLPDDIPVVVDTYSNTETWLENYFATDGHWKIHGAYQAYTKIAKEFGLTPIEPKSTVTLDTYDFLGANARVGLYLYDSSDRIEDYIFELPDYKVTKNGKSIKPNKKQDYFDEKVKEKNATYSGYFGINRNQNGAIYQQESSTAERGTLLIIGDSYATALTPMIASHYESTHIVQPILINDGSTLADYLENNEVDDVLIMETAANYTRPQFQQYFGINNSENPIDPNEND